MAQGAKPGEGGQLPGHKVDEYIGKIRHSTPGVGLISPPPHHDIYSIEDLAQLIHDLKNANPRARVSVKLVAEVGVGTVAAGVAKAKADVVLISGDAGGTGASPLTSIKHAGIPWELGLAETQQMLVLNDLRGRIVVQTDGQLKTGRDVAIAALLGAEEFGFATAPLVASGCIMMRVCHLNTCPVGVATQDPELRKKFAGKPEHVDQLLLLRRRGASARSWPQLGFRTLDEMIGRVDMLEFSDGASSTGRRKGLDLSRDPAQARRAGRASRRAASQTQDHGLEQRARQRADRAGAGRRSSDSEPVELELPIRNVNRTVGTMLGGEIARRYGDDGPAGRHDPHQVHRLGRPELRRVPRHGHHADARRRRQRLRRQGPLRRAHRRLSRRATATLRARGEHHRRQRRALRRDRAARCTSAASPASASASATAARTAVVEGVGDHGCEYMTGGRVVVLGPTGRNFAAGMSGGIAYVSTTTGDFAQPLQHGHGRARAARRREDMRDRCARCSSATSSYTGSARRRAASSTTGTRRRAQFVEGDAARLQARARWPKREHAPSRASRAFARARRRGERDG